jgi:hypothetical protein
MMETAQPWHRYDAVTYFGILLCLSAGRRSLRQRKMLAVLMVITDIIFHEGGREVGRDLDFYNLDACASPEFHPDVRRDCFGKVNERHR